MQFLLISKNRVTRVYREYTAGGQTINHTNHKNLSSQKHNILADYAKLTSKSNKVLKKNNFRPGIALSVSSKL